MVPNQWLRMTAQRRIILEELNLASRHATADEVYERVRRRMPHISLATVYRNLELFARQGIIQKIETGGTQKRFDANPLEHHHVRCEQCGAIEDVELDSLPFSIELVESVTNYVIKGFHLVFVGICPACRAGRSQRS